MARYALSKSDRMVPADEEAQGLSLMSPIRGVMRKVHSAIPFTKKGAVVLIKGQPAIEPCSAAAKPSAALTAVRFRGKVERGDDNPGRYYILASLADPWAQRALIAHGLAGLQKSVGVVSADGLWPLAKGLPAIATQGWRFSKRSQIRPQLFKSCGPEIQKVAKKGSVYMHDIYAATDPEVTGRVTIPVLWDSATGKVVNNDSGDIVRILHQGLKNIGDTEIDLYPEHLRSEIDRVRAIIYGFNAGVYKCGFAVTRDAYHRALRETFGALDVCEQLLEDREYLAGDCLTECDILAFPTLIRFDVSYYTAFRCNMRRVREYKNISRYLEKLYQMDAFKETVHFPTYPCVHFIEAQWQGRLVGNVVRLYESYVDIFTGAAVPGASWWRRATSGILTIPAKVLSRVFK